MIDQKNFSASSNGILGLFMPGACAVQSDSSASN